MDIRTQVSLLIKLHAYLTRLALCMYRRQQMSLGNQEARYESEPKHITRSGYEFLVLKQKSVD